jgi:hypothetical protein
MKSPLWIRNLPHFRLRLEWFGGRRIYVKDYDDNIISIAKTSNSDPKAVARVMRRLEDTMDYFVEM